MTIHISFQTISISHTYENQSREAAFGQMSGMKTLSRKTWRGSVRRHKNQSYNETKDKPGRSSSDACAMGQTPRWGATRCGHAKYDIDQLTSRPRQACTHEWNAWQDRRRDEGKRGSKRTREGGRKGGRTMKLLPRWKQPLERGPHDLDLFLWTICQHTAEPLWSGLLYLAKMLRTCAENCQNQATTTTRTRRRTTMKTGSLRAVSLG